MAVKTYSPDEMSVILGGAIISGFADGESIKITHNEDAMTLQIGSQGHGTRTKNANKSGRLELVLQQTSESNAVLQAFATQDRVSGNAFFPMLVKDNSGSDIHTAETMWVVKEPDASYGKEATSRTWVLETDSLNSFLAGN